MFFSFFNWFAKITGWPIQFFCFRTKIFYENKKVQSRRVKGKAILIANHTSVFDYPVMMFVFFGRTIRVQMAELLFRKPFLGPLLRLLGGIYVDRDLHDMSAIYRSEKILRKGGVVGIWPEGRIPRQEEKTPLAFKTGAAYLALSTNTAIIPMFTDGSYFDLKRRAHVIIGEPIDPMEHADPALSERENVEKLTRIMRETVIRLGENLKEKTEA